MSRYVTFDLGLSLGEVSGVSRVRGALRPRGDAFWWQVEVIDDDVHVHGLVGRELAYLGRARWDGAELVDRLSETADFPNAHQWGLVRDGVALVLGQEQVHGTVRLSARRPRAARQRRVMIAAGVAAPALVVLGVAVLVLRGSSSSSPAPRARPAPVPEATSARVEVASTPAPVPASPPAAAPPLDEQIVAAASVDDAIALAAPTLGDGADAPGAWLLARHAAARMTWSDVAREAPETSFGLVLKDSARERGRRMCATGVLRDIERRDVDGRAVYVGSMATAEGDVARFIAVGDTGALVRRSTGTLCGVVTGKDGDAAVLVGMFDLPENRAPAVERP